MPSEGQVQNLLHMQSRTWLRSQTLRAAMHIPRGRELTVCYLKGFTTSWRVQRQGALRRGFNFICQCEVNVIWMTTPRSNGRLVALLGERQYGC